MPDGLPGLSCQSFARRSLAVDPLHMPTFGLCYRRISGSIQHDPPDLGFSQVISSSGDLSRRNLTQDHQLWFSIWRGESFASTHRDDSLNIQRPTASIRISLVLSVKILGSTPSLMLPFVVMAVATNSWVAKFRQPYGPTVWDNIADVI